MCFFCNEEFYTIGKDYACFRKKGSELYSKLDKKFLKMIETFEYEEFRVPSLINGTYLERCGYFESFPNQLNLVGAIDEKYIPQIMNGDVIDKSCIKLDNQFLNPAACLPIYPLFENQEIDKNMTITTLAEVYRYEETSISDLRRLRNFSVREIVFIGEKKFVINSLNKVKEVAYLFAKEICENAYIEIAHDNFFRTRKNLIKSRIQQVNSLKHELCIPIDGQEVAVSSFNFHNDHFSKTYNFKGDKDIVTGCVGFGMERWISACLNNRIPKL